MTTETTERLAREAGMYFAKDDFANATECIECSPDSLARAFASVRAAALEEAAKVCDPLNPPHDWTEYAKTRAGCATAIRALAAQEKT